MQRINMAELLKNLFDLSMFRIRFEKMAYRRIAFLKKNLSL
jgi:hypothetical protein